MNGRRRLRKSKQTTLINSDPKSTSESMPEPQSSSGYLEGCERRDVVVDSNVSHATNIISNHDFSEGLHSWHANCCHAYVASKEFSLPNGPNGVVAYSGESYIVITNRTECWQGLEQDITGKLSIDTKYDVSVFVRVHGNLQGSCGVQATLRLENSDSGISYFCAGRKSVTKESWEKLEGSFTLTSLPSRAIFYLEGPPPGVDILINSVIILPTSSEYYGVLSCCKESHDELIEQVLLFIVRNKYLGINEVVGLLRPFIVFCMIWKSSSACVYFFSRNLISAIASLSCSFPLEAISILKLLTDCLKYLPLTNQEEFLYIVTCCTYCGCFCCRLATNSWH